MANIKLSDKFRIAETDTFSEKIKRPELRPIYAKIKNFIYPQLKNNPFYGPNIKKLKGDFAGIYRYRIGNYRLFYTIKTDMVIVFILDLTHRKDSYK